MATVVAPPLPWDWDALRSPEWHERRARKRAIRAEFKRVRDIGLARRHAVKLARIHAACSTDPDGTVHCRVDARFSAECPSRLALIDPLDEWPDVVEDPWSTRLVPAEQVVQLTREESLAPIASPDQPAPAAERRPPTRPPAPPSTATRPAEAPPPRAATAPPAQATPAAIAPTAEAAPPAAMAPTAEAAPPAAMAPTAEAAPPSAMAPTAQATPAAMAPTAEPAPPAAAVIRPAEATPPV